MPVPKHLVLDTNVLVSSLLSRRASPPSEIVSLVLNEFIKLCYDDRILEEYKNVLQRPHFKFDPLLVKDVLATIEFAGFDVVPERLPAVTSDPDDQAFYEVSKLCVCPLVTGNKKDFPNEPHIMTPSEYLDAMRG